MGHLMETPTLESTKLRRRQSRQRVVLDVVPRKYDFLMELLRNFDFVRVADLGGDGDSRDDVIASLRASAKDLRAIRAGKYEGRPAEELLAEL